MKIIQSSDYRIYFDDVQMDPYIKSWTAACGLRASDAVATITMYRSKNLELWKGYLTHVRIFARNVFSGKFCIVFEGEIMNRSWGDSRNDTGEITFSCKGFYHWLDTPIPLMIGQEEALDKIQRFRYEAQNIDVDAVQNLFAIQSEIVMKDKSIREIIDALLDAMEAGYYLNDDSSFTWVKLKERFKVMGEVIKEFRMAGYLDTFTFVRASQIDSFYVYLNQVLTQLMFEFYQDRDGAFRIKNPSWKDDILRTHVLDESVVQSASGFNDWENEPSRVLVIGGKQDLARTGSPILGLGNIQNVPMGLYIGKPGEGQYFSETVELMMENFGTSDETTYTDGTVPANGTVMDSKDPATIGAGHGKGGMLLQVETVYNAVKDKFGPTVFMGAYNNRNVRGGSTKSMHAYGRAFDIGGEPAVMQKIADYCRTIENVQYVIYNRKISGPGANKPWRAYSGENPHTDHVHVDFPVDFKGIGGNGTATTSTTTDATSATDTQLINQDLKNQSKWSAAQLNKWINSKAKSGSLMYNRGQAFYQAAKESGLDPLYLVAHAAHETGWGTSNIARRKYNFYGIAAFDASPFASAYNWSGADAGIIAGAKWIRQNFYDKAQNTLYKMRFSPSGTHNYATDSKWHAKIAAIWKTSNAPAGAAGGDVQATSSGTTTSSGPSTMYMGTPYAFTGGFTFTTRYKNSTAVDAVKAITAAATGKETNTSAAVAIDYNAFSTSTLKMIIPWTAGSYSKYITSKPNGVNMNMICAVIETVSGWKEKMVRSVATGKSIYGLMGVHTDYINGVLGGKTSTMYEPQTNIYHATLLFKNALARFSNKPTFALASVFSGSMSPVEDWIKAAGAEDFSKVRNVIPTEYKYVASMVDNAVERFVKAFNGDYIKGDPHRTFSVQNGSQTTVETGLTDDPTVKDYESSYKPVMSDEERLFKVNLKISEQLLIRYDTPAAGTSDTESSETMNADELVERYARYMMQLYRAESHGVNVPLSTCMPFIRPGFNAWLEPTRRDLVFYITRVSHQGSFGNGAFSTVTGAFVRDPASYDSIEDNIFVSTTNASAKDFGQIVSKKDMPSLKKELQTLHSSDEVVADARAVPTLSKLYSSAGGTESEYTTIWNNELTHDELKKKITALYAGAPQVVLNRKATLAKIVTESADFFTKMLLNTKF